MLDLQNAEIFRAALESLQTGVCIVDRDRKISYWNDGAERITGYLRQDVVGRFCGDILLIKFHEKKDGILRAVLPAGCRHARRAAARGARLSASQVRICRAGQLARRSHPGRRRPCDWRDGKLCREAVGVHDGGVRTPIWPSATGWTRSRSSRTIPLRNLTLSIASNSPPNTSFPSACSAFSWTNLDALTATHGSGRGGGHPECCRAHAAQRHRSPGLRRPLVGRPVSGHRQRQQSAELIDHRRAAEAARPILRDRLVGRSSLSVTVSVGGTVVRPGESLDALLERTGNALKQAVAQGGNSAVVLGRAGNAVSKER